MALKNSDFIEIEYTAIDKESGQIFDLTSEKEAKEHNLYNPKAQYKPIIICIGEKQVIPGLDKFLPGKEFNKEYTLEIPPEEGFGKKDPKLLKLIPSKVFKKENINPFPGLQINIDNMRGTVRTVSGGRIIVDFNHPLSGHNLIYKIKITRIIKDEKTKVESIVGMLVPNPKVEIKKSGTEKNPTLTAEISLDLPDVLQTQLKNQILKTIPTLKDVKFKTPDKK